VAIEQARGSGLELAEQIDVGHGSTVAPTDRHARHSPNTFTPRS